MWTLGLLVLAGCSAELPAPPGRRGARGAVGNAELWTVGGEDEHGLVAEVWSFDLSDRYWRQHAPAPVAMGWGAVVWDGAAFVVIAGNTPDGLSGRVWRLDPRADSWDELAPMPLPRERFGVAIEGGTLILTGGVGPDGLPYEDAWTLTEGVWNEVAPDLGIGGFADVTLMAGEAGIYQVGGTLVGTADALYNVSGAQLVPVDVGLGNLAGACGLLDDEVVWIWGGERESVLHGWSGYWRTPAEAEPEPRAWPLCAPSGEYLYVLGGDSGFGTEPGPFRQDLWRMRKGEWRQLIDGDGQPVEE